MTDDAVQPGHNTAGRRTSKHVKQKIVLVRRGSGLGNSSPGSEYKRGGKGEAVISTTQVKKVRWKEGVKNLLRGRMGGRDGG